MTQAQQHRRPFEDAGWPGAERMLALLPAAVVVTNGAGAIVGANAAAEDLLGLEVRFLRPNKPLTVFVEDARSFLRFVRGLRTLGPGNVARTELIVTSRDQSRVHTSVAVRVIAAELDDDDRAYIWVFTDIDRRVSAEGELRLFAEELEGRVLERTGELEVERARLAAIIDEIPAGLVVADAPSGRIAFTNRRAEELLRRPPLAAGSVDAYDPGQGRWPDGREVQPHEWPLARALEHGEVVRQERMEVRRGDGTWMAIEANAAPIRDPQGGIASAAVVFWDISERERRERSEREFITNAAHELQTPLAAIVTAIEVLMSGAKDIPEDRERFLAHIDRESGRLVRIVRSLLVLARTQLAGESVETGPVRVRALLDEIALGLHPRAGIEVLVRCPARLTVTTSWDMLEQAVGNLASNSARHTLEGRIVLAASRTGEGVCIEVSDTGPGIAAEDAERLFDRFARGAGPRSGDGFGLGLAIVRETVTALGGIVSLAPRRGGGTVARIVLPETGKESA